MSEDGVDVLVLTARFLWDRSFRIGSGQAAEGVDDALDVATALSETSVRNRLKSGAREVGVPESTVREVFEGGAGGGCWNLLVDQPVVSRATVSHIRIDPTTRTVEPTGLTTRHDVVDDAVNDTARLRFSLLRPLDDEARRRHVLVLLTGARASKSVGGSRHRGLGSWDVRLQSCAVSDVRGSGLRDQLHRAGVTLDRTRRGAS